MTCIPMNLKKHHLLLILFFLPLLPGYAQSNSFHMEYLNTVGTLQSRGVAEGPTGYFIGGMVQTSPGNNFDNYVMHTDVNGNPTWVYRYSDTVSWQITSALCITSDSGCAITGFVDTNNVTHWTVVRLDKNGNIRWAGKYKNPSGNAYPKKIKQTADGGFIATGEYVSATNSYYNILLKLDSAGNVQWSKRYLVHTAPVPSRNMDVLQTADGGYTMLGSSYQAGTLTDCRMIHVDSAGHFLWAKSYGGTYSDWPQGMMQLPNGNYVIAMNYYQNINFITYSGPMLLFTDSAGNELASKWHPSALDFRIAGINSAPNGNIMLSGMLYGPIGPFYACGASILYNANGQLQLVKLYGDNDMEEVFATTAVSGGGQLLAGDVITGNPNTMLLIKTDSLLAVPCNTTDSLVPPMANSHISYTTQPDDTLPLIHTNYVLNQLPFPQTVVNVCLTTGTENEKTAEQPVVFPNPSAGQFTIRLPDGNERWQVDVYDITGKCIRRIASEIPELQLNFEQEAAGMYLLRITRGTSCYSHKICIRR